MQYGIVRFYQYFQLDAPDLETHVLFDLRQKAINKKNIFGTITFGDDDNVDVTPGRFDYIDQVAIEEACPDVVRPVGTNLVAKVQCIESLDDRFAGLYLL